MSAADDLTGHFHRLRELVRSPSYRQLEREADRIGHRLPSSTIGTLLAGTGSPRWETVESFVLACRHLAHTRRPAVDVDPAEFDLNIWLRRFEERTGPEPAPAADELTYSVVTPLRPYPFVARTELTRRLFEALDAGADLAGLVGPGGYGKTTQAAEIIRNPGLRRRFPDGVHWVTVGTELSGPTLAEAVNQLAAELGDQTPTFTDPERAGYHLGGLLAHSRRLIVIDDIWNQGQLTPFLLGGPQCVRLVTTRVRSVLPRHAAVIAVERLTTAETEGLLEGFTRTGVSKLAALTGGWPILVGLVHAALGRYVEHGAPPATAVDRVERRLDSHGPAAWDMSDATHRSAAVRATVEAGLTLLAERHPPWLNRYLELAVFASATTIPQETLERYWASTGGMTAEDTELLCLELCDLSLLQGYQMAGPARVTLHDVLSEYLVHRVGARLPELHKALVDAHRPLLADPEAWWTQPADDSYLWQHLARHLAACGESGRAEMACTVTDLRWAAAKIRAGYAVSLTADLELLGSDLSEALRRLFTRILHLLVAIKPPSALMGNIIARLDGVTVPLPRSESWLAPVWPLPDQPPASLVRVMLAASPVGAVAVDSQNRSVISAGHDGKLRFWDLDTGALIVTREDQDGSVRSMAVALNGRWLVVGREDGTVETRALPGGARHATAQLGGGSTESVAIAPDGTWLAVGGAAGVEIRDPTSLEIIAALGETDGTQMAIAPDGSWLATAGWATVQFWRTSDWSLTGTVAAHTGPVEALTVGPEGDWLATAGWDGMIKVWDVSPPVLRTRLSGAGGPGTSLAAGPGKGGLVAAGRDGVIRLWDIDSERLRAVLAGHVDNVDAVATAGKWIVSGGQDGTVRLWNETHASGGNKSTPVIGRFEAAAVSQSGQWVVGTEPTGAVRLFDMVDGRQRRALPGHTAPVQAVAAAPDDSATVVTGSWDCTAVVWDTEDGSVRNTLFGHQDAVAAVAFHPHGRRVVTGGWDGLAQVWNLPDGVVSATLIHPARVTAVATTEDRVFTGCHDGAVRVWSLESGALLVALPGPAGSVAALAVTAGGDWLVTAGNDGTIRAWDLSDGTTRIISADAGPVQALAISPVADRIVTAGGDGALRVWDSDTGECVASLKTDGPLAGCSYHPDGKRIVAVGASGMFFVQLIGRSDRQDTLGDKDGPAT